MYHIVYPGGDKSKLTICEIDKWCDDLEDYSVASRKSFEDEAEAAAYARELAQKHGLVFESDSQEANYLD